MRRRLLFCLVSALVVLNGVQGWGAPSVLTFDDIPGGWVPIPDGYGGLTWNGFYTIRQSSWPGSGYDLGCVSPDKVAYNNDWYGSSISGELFDFYGAYMTAAYQSSMDVRLQGYRGAAVVYDVTVTTVNTGPTWFDFDFLGIDKLEFHPTVVSGGPQVAIDNFEYSVIPAPAAILLGLIGTGIVGGLRRRKGI